MAFCALPTLVTVALDPADNVVVVPTVTDATTGPTVDVVPSL